jgi:cation diffusion facilitator CzcD-associated flavoprotein CzcO
MQQMSADVDVVIIGAGAAGIAAARRLAASHLSAIVLEATARVYGSRLEKDRSPSQSRRSIASAK